MANKTINGITTELESVASADLLPVWDASEGKTAKVTKSNFLGLDTYPTSNSNNAVKSSGIFATNAVIMASSTTITSAPTISSGSVIRVMFTSAITGSDTSTALSLTYNNTAYSVKVGKQGSLANFVASYVNSTYTYLQAYTTLELAFDGTQFIIIGNPVVLSSSDYTIYADGQTVGIDTTPTSGSTNFVTSGGLYTKLAYKVDKIKLLLASYNSSSSVYVGICDVTDWYADPSTAVISGFMGQFVSVRENYDSNATMANIGSLYLQTNGSTVGQRVLVENDYNIGCYLTPVIFSVSDTYYLGFKTSVSYRPFIWLTGIFYNALSTPVVYASGSVTEIYAGTRNAITYTSS